MRRAFDRARHRRPHGEPDRRGAASRARRDDGQHRAGGAREGAVVPARMGAVACARGVRRRRADRDGARQGFDAVRARAGDRRCAAPRRRASRRQSARARGGGRERAQPAARASRGRAADPRVARLRGRGARVRARRGRLARRHQVSRERRGGARARGRRMRSGGLSSAARRVSRSLRADLSAMARRCRSRADSPDASPARPVRAARQPEADRGARRSRARRHPLRQPATGLRHADAARSRAARDRHRSGANRRLRVGGAHAFGDRRVRRERDGRSRLRRRAGGAPLRARLHCGRRRRLLLRVRALAARRCAARGRARLAARRRLPRHGGAARRL